MPVCMHKKITSVFSPNLSCTQPPYFEDNQWSLGISGGSWKQMKMSRQDQGFWISGGLNIALSKFAVVFGFQSQSHSIACICETVKLVWHQ